MSIYGYGVEGVLNKIKEPDIFRQLQCILNIYSSIDFIPDYVSIQDGFSSSLFIDLIIFAEKDDIIVVDSLGRLAFSHKSFYDILYYLEQKEIKLKVIDTPPALYAARLESILSVESRISRIMAIDDITDAMVRGKNITDKLTALRNVAPSMLNIASRRNIQLVK